MKRCNFVFVCSVYLNMLVIYVSGLTMHDCIGGWIDIPEDTSTFITCSNISKTENVMWRVENDVRNETIHDIVCGSISACNAFNSTEISLQSFGDDGLSLVINKNHRRYGGFIVTCSTTTKHAQCRMHVFRRTTSRPPLETTRVIYTEQPAETSEKTLQATHVTTFPSSNDGPQSVRISTDATQPFVTDGTVQMALFCETDDAYAGVKYTWAGVTCINENHEHGKCIFTPRVPQDDGHQVSCDAYNKVSLDQRASEPYTIQLSYPPPSPPSIRGYRAGWILTEGENITLYCVVEGGKPKVSSVTFFCGDGPDKQDSVDNKFVWSSVIINLKAQHNNTVCECKATWNPKPEFYSYITSVRLYVCEKTTSPLPLETTREMHTEQPTKTPIKTSQVTHVTTFPSSKGFVSSPPDQMDSSPSSQNKLSQSTTTGVIAGIVAAVVATVIVIAVIVYVTRRQQNRSTTPNTHFKDNTQDDDFEEQINSVYISADAVALDRIRPVDGSLQSRVQDPVSQLSPQTYSDATHKVTEQRASSSSTSLSAHQTQTLQPCLKELEKKRESTSSNTEHFYAVVADL